MLDQSGPTVKPILDFNGDGKTDYTVTRDNGGNKIWYTSLNGPGTFSGVQWGLSASDYETPADFDGDGKADIAVWRSAPSGQASYYILRSSDSTVQTELFGQAGDDPSVTGDYDGDGKADPAVFRCPSGSAGQCFFYYRGSLNNAARNITYVPWGYGIQSVSQTTIRSAAGDYDGDGKYDFCVFVDGGGGAGMFILLKSSNFGIEYVPWGLTTDLIIPRGDFDGDGKTDFAVARLGGSNYNMYTLTRTGGGTGASPYVFGSAGDDGAFGDYDGDGKTDIGLWRPSSGTFYIVNSSTGSLATYPWGLNGDTPVANWIFPNGQ